MLLLLASSAPALPESQEEGPRAAALAESQALAAQGRFAEALPHAQAYVQLTEAQDAGADELAAAHLNLGRLQWQLGDPAAAEMNVGQALELTKSSSGIVSPRLIAPLALLASVYEAQGRHAEAARTLTHAIAITRRTDGLFSLKQLPLVESLVAVQRATGNSDGVERELKFAVLASRQQLGPTHLQTLDAILDLADWYVYVQSYDLARFQYAQVIESHAAEREADLGLELPVRALLGLTRSHRLQFANDPRSLAATAESIDPATGRTTPVLTTAQRVSAIKLNSAGEKAARRALAILESVPEPPRELLFDAFVELGDWFITARRPDVASSYYTRAWDLFGSDDERLEMLRQPRILVYRPPAAATRSRERWEGTIPPREIDFTLTVRADGETTDVALATPDAPPGQVGQIRRALELAIFSPRIEAGQPVPTTGYRITEHWYEMASESIQQSNSAQPEPRS